MQENVAILNSYVSFKINNIYKIGIYKINSSSITQFMCSSSIPYKNLGFSLSDQKSAYFVVGAQFIKVNLTSLTATSYYNFPNTTSVFLNFYQYSDYLAISYLTPSNPNNTYSISLNIAANTILSILFVNSSFCEKLYFYK